MSVQFGDLLTKVGFRGTPAPVETSPVRGVDTETSGGIASINNPLESGYNGYGQSYMLPGVGYVSKAETFNISV